MEKFSKQFRLNPNIKLRNDDLKWHQNYETFFYFLSEYFHYYSPIVVGGPLDPMRRKNKNYPLMLQRLQNFLNISRTPIPVADQIEITRELFTQFFVEFREKTELYRLLQVLRNLPKGIRFFNNKRRKDRGIQRSQIKFLDEYDFQDYLGFLLHVNFELIPEFPIPPRTHDSQGGRVEFYIPSCKALVECKFIDSEEKKRREEQSVHDKQIKYTNIQSLKYLIFVFWDANNVITDIEGFEIKNSYPMIIDENHFEVIFLVLKV